MQSCKLGRRFSSKLALVPKMALAIAAGTVAISAWNCQRADAATTVENYAGNIVDYTVTASGVYEYCRLRCRWRRGRKRELWRFRC